MIDLSHLTEEEQAMIMAVLNRDSELKKSEEERIKHLQKEVPEEDRRKYMTGEWFYEVKSQRHQDRIHGSDIIIASMKHQQKPTIDAASALADYLTRSWGKSSSSFNKKNSDEISEQPMERQLQKEDPEEDRRKHMTGESFYKVKSQKHQDGIDGSDIIITSLKQQKPTIDAASALADYLTRSWGKSSSSFDKNNSDEISEQPMERVNQGGTPEVQEESLNRCKRSPSKPRHNPFNSIPVEPDFEETGSRFTSESELRRSSADIGFDSKVKHQEPNHAENNREFSNIVPNIIPRQKPVPMKRTKIFKPHGSLSDSASSVSSQSMSIPSTSNKSVTTTEDSAIRTPAPRGILKNSSCESTLKSQLPQPILNYVHPNNYQEKDSEERKNILESKEEPSRRSLSEEPPKCPSLSKAPKSRLPVMNQSQKINLSQATQETEKIQKRPSLNSIPRVDDDKKVEDSLKQQRNTYNCLPLSSSIERGDQNISDKIMETSPHENARTTNTIEALDVMTTSKPTQQRYETVESHMTVLPNVQMTREEEHLGTPDDQQFPSSLNIADSSKIGNSSTDLEPESSPSAFNIKLNTKNSFESQPAVMTDSPIHTPSAEHGKSITKVLEWFSRSSDSSDMFDVDSNRDMEEDPKIDDIDLEDAANLRVKTRENVYLIMPRQSEENPSEVNSVFLQGTDWAQEKSFDKVRQTTPKPRRRSESTHKQSPIMNPSTNFTFTDIPNTVTESEDNVFWTPDENKQDAFIKHDRREEPKVKLETNVIKVHQPKERTSVTEDQGPKLANLKSFWEKENTGPKILIGRSNVPAKNEPLTLDVSTESNKGGNDKLEKNLKSPEHQINETVSVVEVSDFKDVLSTNTIQSVPNVTGDSKVSQLIYSNPKKDQILSSSSTDKCATSVPRLKSSSSSLDSGSLLAHQDIESVGGTVSINNSDGDCTAPKVLETKSTTPPRPIPFPRAKQTENMVDKIKQLKSFWENEKSTSAQKSKPSMASSAKLNKRFTKSEFDLTTVGTEFDDVFEDDTNDKGSLSPGFSRNTSRPAVIEGMSTSQFKNLRDFWGGSPQNQMGQTSPVSKSGIQRTFGQPKKHSKSVDTSKETDSFIDATSHAQVKMYNKQSESQTNTKQAGLNASAKRRDTTRQQSGSKSSSSNVDSDEAISHGVSHPVQTSVKHITPPKPSIGQESQPQQRKSRGKGRLNVKINSIRRASSMFSINTEVEEQSQDSKTSQSPNLHQVTNTTENNMAPSKKTQESSDTLPKTPSEYSLQDKEGNIQTRPSRTSEETDVQPLARSFIPPDYQHYLGITEKSDMYTPPSVTRQMDEDDFLCTSFTTSTETSCKCKCSPVRTSTPVPGFPDLQTRRGSLAQTDGHVCHNASQISAPDTPSRTKGNINCDESLVQKVLKRATTRPVYHKSMDNISTSPGQNIKHMDDFEQVPSTYVQTSFTTSDSEHLKQLSKSVPSFLQKEIDEGESDSESSCSGVPLKNFRQYTNLDSCSGFASMSSVSGSVASVYSSDYGSVEVQGIIQFSLNYVQKLREFHIFVIQCQNLAAVDMKKNRSDPYVKSYLIPDSANLGKRKTSVKKKTLNPTYKEILRYRVQKDYLKSQVLNLSVWHHDTFGRNSFLGETEFDLSLWNFSDTERKFLPLKPRNRSGQSLTSLQPSDLRGQIRLAVRFLPQIFHSKSVPGTGEVHIWVKDCKNLPLIRSPSIDPYVKCFVLPDTSKKSRQKTRVLKKTTSPMFNHTMVYDGFRAEDLKEACIELTVWDRDRLANHLLGGLRLGMGTGKSYGALVSWMDSTPEEVDLWRRMMESPSEWVEDILPLRMLAPEKKAWK
ncbi:uncharacterized protein sytl2b [Paramisgurnus dabryanus]|uniref:uncharacterized protein sytl2b n=1 Tax=Paramisgurnus dabryanus TaxID=90735 RepID=UPI0031F37C34